MRPRISLGLLIILVGACGLGFGAIRDPFAWWAVGLFPLAMASIALAALGAATGRGPAWAGFALAGGLYLALAFAPATRDRLPTSRAIDRLRAATNEIGILRCPDDIETTPGPGNLSYSVSGFRRWNGPITPPPPTARFLVPGMAAEHQAGHSTLALLAGTAGAIVARLRAGVRRENR